MRLLSVEIEGVHRVVEVVGDELVPLEGLRELGADTTIDAVRGARRDLSSRMPAAAVKLRPLVPHPGKVFCVGLNYLSHVQETKRDLPEYPVLFPKFGSSLIAPDADIQLPPESSQVDYEAELAVVIGRAGRRIPEEEAEDYILGYTVANDVTMRDYQYKTHQWLQGKAWDASTPLGPALVTPEEIDISDLRISTTLNGEVLQDSRTSLLMFSVPRLISMISEFTALEPGDIILSGTPSGVGFRREPQIFLHDGDVVEVEIEGIGRIRNRVVSEQLS
jgi:acylpyruvate hydrolase